MNNIGNAAARPDTSGHTGRARTLDRRVTWGLLAAWAVHDLEELITMSAWTTRHADQLPSRVAQNASPAHAALAIGTMGVLVTAASAVGARSSGESRFFQAALAGFGLHGFGHLALSARFRGYTPGVLTSPSLVLPFSAWAWQQLGQSGVRKPVGGTVVRAAGLMAGSLAVAHLTAGAVRAGHRLSRSH